VYVNSPCASTWQAPGVERGKVYFVIWLLHLVLGLRCPENLPSVHPRARYALVKATPTGRDLLSWMMALV
jgi:hypothetical protein